MNNIGLAYNNISQPQEALKYFNQALPMWREVGDRRGEATTLNNIGAAYDSLSQSQEALKYYNQALPMWRELGDRAREAATLRNIDAVNNRSQPPSRTNIPPIPK
ncbi:MULTISPECIES: tetratricopeptide repeat protein [unclassified Microcoleus]|uniref:tetratricopeptide repeat protein n=1 Tax=unclassified Microcoleus TaxID=2642155 RepID=UPI002FD7725A